MRRKWTLKVRPFCAQWQGPGRATFCAVLLWTLILFLVRRSSFEAKLEGNRSCYKQLIDKAIPSIFPKTSERAITTKRKCDATTKRLRHVGKACCILPVNTVKIRQKVNIL